MTYNKPTNMTYTQMAMYFDAHVYDENRDDNILYQYLYHLFHMLACRGRYFRNDDYDEFALYAATRVYLRYPAKNVCANTPKEKRLRSVLNYVKATIYPLKVDYQKETFSQLYNYQNEEGTLDLINITKTSIQKDYSQGLSEAVIDSLALLPKTIIKIITDTPYKTDKIMIKKLYMSCLLTFINSMTLSTDKLRKILKKSDVNEREKLYVKALQREKQDSVMTWHLDESHKDYIRVLVNKIRRSIDNTLTDTQNSFNLSESELDSIMVSAFTNTGNNQTNSYEETQY